MQIWLLFYLQNCRCTFHDFALFTRVQISTATQQLCNQFKCIKISGNDVNVSDDVNIGERPEFRPIDHRSTSQSVKQCFVEMCQEVPYHRLKVCFENAAALIVDEPSTKLHKCIAEFIERMIDAYMPFGIFNSEGLSDARRVLTEIQLVLSGGRPIPDLYEKKLRKKSNQFYQMIPHIEFNFCRPRKLPLIDTLTLCRNKMELIDRLEAVMGALEAGRQTENMNPLDFIYNNFMDADLRPIETEHADYTTFVNEFSIEHTEMIKCLFSMKFRHEPTTSTDERLTENVHYLFHATHSNNMIDILRDGLRIAPNHVFSYNRWYGCGIYFYGDFKAVYQHANRLRQKIILVCRVELGNIEILEDCNNIYRYPNEPYPLQDGKNSLKVCGRLTRSSFQFNDNFSAFVPLKSYSTHSVMEKLSIVSESSYRLDDEFVVLHENQVKIQYIIELND